MSDVHEESVASAESVADARRLDTLAAEHAPEFLGMSVEDAERHARAVGVHLRVRGGSGWYTDDHVRGRVTADAADGRIVKALPG